jgi:hypothetical protein
MNYIEIIELYNEQGVWESASMVCLNAFKATGIELYHMASKRFTTAHKYGRGMQSSAALAASDAMHVAKLANKEENELK